MRTSFCDHDRKSTTKAVAAGSRPHRIPKQREVSRLRDAHVENLAEMAITVAFKDHDAFRSRAASQTRLIRLARPFAEDLDVLTDESIIHRQHPEDRGGGLPA